MQGNLASKCFLFRAYLWDPIEAEMLRDKCHCDATGSYLYVVTSIIASSEFNQDILQKVGLPLGIETLDLKDETRELLKGDLLFRICKILFLKIGKIVSKICNQLNPKTVNHCGWRQNFTLTGGTKIIEL